MDSITLSIGLIYLVIFLYNGTDYLVRGGELRKKGLRLVVSGLIIFVVSGGSFLWFVNSYNHYVQVDTSSTFISQLHEYQKNVDSSLPVADREKFGRQVASDIYQFEGKLISYPNGSGGHILYSPSQVDISLREDRIRKHAEIETMYEGFKADAKALIMLGAFSVVLGLMEGLIERRKKEG